MACRRVFPRSITTMSGRGTITSRAIVSPSSNTEWIICRSSSSISRSCSARSTSSRSSASDVNGPLRNPRPGVNALPSRMSSCVIGPSTVASSATGPASTTATWAGCCRAIVRGATPTSTYDTTTITAVATTTASQAGERCSRATRATSTVARTSQVTRPSSATFTYRAGSATT